MTSAAISMQSLDDDSRAWIHCSFSSNVKLGNSWRPRPSKRWRCDGARGSKGDDVCILLGGGNVAFCCDCSDDDDVSFSCLLVNESVRGVLLGLVAVAKCRTGVGVVDKNDILVAVGTEACGRTTPTRGSGLVLLHFVMNLCVVRKHGSCSIEGTTVAWHGFWWRKAFILIPTEKNDDKVCPLSVPC